MTKRALTILLVAVLLVGGATAALALSVSGGDSSTPTHVMPNGKTMNGDTMDNTQTHTMSNGQTVSGSQMDMDK